VTAFPPFRRRRMDNINNYSNIKSLPSFGKVAKILELSEYAKNHPEENLKVTLTKSGLPILQRKSNLEIILERIFGRYMK
jgi:hypothetical protein